ncbi:MAG: T9SS type A sorting domain-containing protein [Bacteroidales bacterium]|nr:T9SS type A sorting domain-containing protein [Bacteroidales bacterium]
MKKLLTLDLIFLMLLTSNSSIAQWVKLDSLDSPILHITTSNERLYVCTATNGVYISSDFGNSFYSSNSGLNNLNTRIILAKDSLLILGTNNSIYKSTNHGESWINSSNGFPSSNSNVEDIIWKGDSILVATYGSGIFCSSDLCQNWFPLNDGFLDLYRSGLLLEGNRIFTGTKYGGSGIYISDNGGLTWEQRNIGVPVNPYNPSKYNDITAFCKKDEMIYASTFGTNVLESSDFGESWTSLNCPNNYIWVVKNVDDILLCGHNGAGVTKSGDMGNTWDFINEGLKYNFDKDIRTFCRLGEFIYTGAWTGNVFRKPISELITNVPKHQDYNCLIIYPNPVTNISRIDIPFPKKEAFMIEIYNENGVCTKKEFRSQTDQVIIRNSDFRPGIYFIRLFQTDKKSIYGKFIVL